jgi:hypothetical protein
METWGNPGLAGWNAPEEPTLADDELKPEDPPWLVEDCALPLPPPDDDKTPPVDDEELEDDDDDDDDDEELLSPGRGHAPRTNTIPTRPN